MIGGANDLYATFNKEVTTNSLNTILSNLDTKLDELKLKKEAWEEYANAIKTALDSIDTSGLDNPPSEDDDDDVPPPEEETGPSAYALAHSKEIAEVGVNSKGQRVFRFVDDDVWYRDTSAANMYDQSDHIAEVGKWMYLTGDALRGWAPYPADVEGKIYQLKESYVDGMQYDG
jgi:hypothetical protein